MSSYELLKYLHMSCALLSVAGFSLRGYWLLADSALLQHKAAKVLPHVVDTVLLGSAIALLVSLGLSPFATSWLIAKIVALLVYIGLGMVALRFGRSRRQRVLALLAAVLTALYIFSVAFSKSAWGPLVLF